MPGIGQIPVGRFHQHEASVALPLQAELRSVECLPHALERLLLRGVDAVAADDVDFHSCVRRARQRIIEEFRPSLEVELTVRPLSHVAPDPVGQLMATEEHQVVQRPISFVAHQRHPPTD